MALQGWVISTIVIAILCVVGFVGIWIWFPRTFMKGFRSEDKIADLELAPPGSSPEEIESARAARNAMSKGIVERAIAREQALKRGEQPSDEPIVPAEFYTRHLHLAPLPSAVAVPQVEHNPSARHPEDSALPAYKLNE